MPPPPRGSTEVYLETGRKRVFAGALDWPGWCRSGRDEEAALEALAAARGRYRAVARDAGLAFSATGGGFEVVERVAGSATTDFGAPAAVAGRDHDPLTRSEAGRLARLVDASWRLLDRVVAGAPAELRKGPRGGGRDRDAIVDHVAAAEVAYARKLGLRLRQPDPADPAAVAQGRDAIVGAIRAAVGPPPATMAWPPRYAARRIAWHVLDHAWEIEDRG